MPSAGESRRAVLKSWLFCTQWIKNTGQNGIGTCAPWEKGTAQLDHRRNSHVELDGLWPAEFDRSEAVGATCAILNVVPLTPERPMCPRERRGTVEWPAEKPCPKPKAACSGQACRQRGRSSIMRNVCRIPTAVRMPAEGSPNSLSAPRSILRHASWPAMPADQACPGHRCLGCRAFAQSAVCASKLLAGRCPAGPCAQSKTHGRGSHVMPASLVCAFGSRVCHAHAPVLSGR